MSGPGVSVYDHRDPEPRLYAEHALRSLLGKTRYLGTFLRATSLNLLLRL